MTENESDLVLDGNAAAGLLQEIFVPEITSAQIECEACGYAAEVGSFASYARRNGSSSTVHPLRRHSHEGGSYGARSLAGNERRTLPQALVVGRSLARQSPQDPGLLQPECLN